VVARRRRPREGRDGAPGAFSAARCVFARPAPDCVPRGVVVSVRVLRRRVRRAPVRRHLRGRALRTEHGLVPRGPRVRARAGRGFRASGRRRRRARRRRRVSRRRGPGADGRGRVPRVPVPFAERRARLRHRVGGVRRVARGGGRPPRRRRRRCGGDSREARPGRLAAVPVGARGGGGGVRAAAPDARRAPRRDFRRRVRSRRASRGRFHPRRFHEKKRPRVFLITRARRRSKRALALARERRRTRRDRSRRVGRGFRTRGDADDDVHHRVHVRVHQPVRSRARDRRFGRAGTRAARDASAAAGVIPAPVVRRAGDVRVPRGGEG